MKVEVLRGPGLARALQDVAQLRIEVFRDWPYLYDGDLAYEAEYLQPYLNSDDAIIVGAFDGAQLVGAATGTPLADHADDFAAAFAGTGLDLGSIFYCAESVLKPGFRGQGIGHKFFDLREAHARELGFTHVAFCAVVRPMDHAARPRQARDLGPFWRGRGYAPLHGVVAQFSWKDLGAETETAKPLQFWMKEL